MNLAQALTSKTKHYAEYILSEEPFFQQLLKGELRPESYALFLENVRYLVTHTPIHLKKAIARSEKFPELKTFFEQKFKEEEGHDVWAEDDLKAMSPHLQRNDFELKVTQEMKTYVELIAAAIDEDPYLYPSYIYYTELLTVLLAEPMNEALENKCNFGKNVATIITSHAELDQHHIVEGEAAIQKLIDEDKYRSKTLAFLEEIIQQHKKMFLSSILN